MCLINRYIYREKEGERERKGDRAREGGRKREGQGERVERERARVSEIKTDI